MYQPELYEGLFQNTQYSIANIPETLIVCGALFSRERSAFLQPSHRNNPSAGRGGSDEYIINFLYSQASPTWSGVETAFVFTKDTVEDISGSLSMIRQLSFVEGDSEAEKQADIFFSQIRVKTKKIMVNSKS